MMKVNNEHNKIKQYIIKEIKSFVAKANYQQKR